MDLKFSIFIFVHLFGSDERRPLTNIKPKENIKISYFDQDIQLLQCQHTKKRIYANFIVLYLRTELRYRRTFFSFEFVSRSPFSNRHQISIKIYFEISL